MRKKYRKILLLKVPHCFHPEALSNDVNFRQLHTFRPIPSFALASLCAFLEKHNTFGYDIKAVDVNIEAYKKPGIPVDIEDFPNLLEETIRSQAYDVLAISMMFVFNVRWLDRAVFLSRKYHPEAKIVAGGGYPTVFPKKCLENHDIDSIVIGEGESTLVHLLNRYNHFIDKKFEGRFPFDGYGEKTKKGEIKIVLKKSFLGMDDIPLPAWQYLNVDNYFEKSGDRVLPIEAVRGCPYHCTFCNTQLTWGYKLRYKKVDRLIKEMKDLDRKYQAQLHFIDDNRTVNRSWMIDFLEKIVHERIVLEPAPASFHANHLDDELLDLLIRAGVKTIGIGVETGSQVMQKHLKKDIDLEKLKKLVKLIKSKGLRVHTNYIVGFPNETMHQIQETLNFARELKAHSNQFLILVPYPKTEIYKEAERNHLFTFDEFDLDHFDPRKSNFIHSDEWTYVQLSEMIYDANIDLNFLNNPGLSEEEYWDDFLSFLENLRLRIPGHVIAIIILGYMYKYREVADNWEKYYLEAVECLKKKEVYEVFKKYLFWDHPIINDFNSYCDLNNILMSFV